jgi:hypothetical protein
MYQKESVLTSNSTVWTSDQNVTSANHLPDIRPKADIQDHLPDIQPNPDIQNVRFSHPIQSEHPIITLADTDPRVTSKNDLANIRRAG